MTSPTIKKRNINTTILVDKHQPHIFEFDKHPVFDEHSIQQSLTAELIIHQDTVLNINTHLFYAKKIQIVTPKTDALIEGQSVHLNLNILHQKFKQDYFLNIPCILGKIEKYQHVVHATLTFTKETSPQFNRWYQQWFNKHQEEHKNNDIDENTFSFIYQYYKRITAVHLTTPILFSDSQNIIHAFISQSCRSDITFSAEPDIQIPLSIFQPYIAQQKKETRIPLYIWYEDNKIHYFSNKDYPKVSSKNIISWLIKKPMWRVLLLCHSSVIPPTENQITEIKQYCSEQVINNTRLFTQSFSKLNSVTKIINISGLFTHISFPTYTGTLIENEQPLEKLNTHYQTLSFQIKRTEHRFPYKTTLELTTIKLENNITLQAETTDISFLGFNMILPLAEYPIKEGDLISINFTEWNAKQPQGLFNKKELLKPTVYEVTKIVHHSERINLGIKRVKRDTDPKINTYIHNVIQEIQQTEKGSLRNTYDLYQSLFASLWINNNITGLKFFLGRDKQGIRIIQAIVSTQKNVKICTPYMASNDWSFLQQIALPLDVAMTELNKKNKQDNTLNIGIYCYYDDKTNTINQWHTKTDLEFDSNQSKTQFIQTALHFKKHYFYHCHLVPIRSGGDDILKGESSSFVSLAAHRLKEINEICHALIAIGELNDVTRLITFMYKDFSPPA